MIDAELLQILCCPETHQSLRWAEPSVIESMNTLVSKKALKNKAGQVVEEKLEGGLVREDNLFLYPVRNNIPVLLVEEALSLNSVGGP